MTSDYGVRVNTDLLRAGSEPFWIRLRELLAERGIDPESALLAACWPDEQGVQAGYIVVPDKRVFWFSMPFGPQPEIPPRTTGYAVGPAGGAQPIELKNPIPARPPNAEEGYFEEWTEITHDRSTQQQGDVQAALKMLEDN